MRPSPLWICLRKDWKEKKSDDVQFRSNSCLFPGVLLPHLPHPAVLADLLWNIQLHRHDTQLCSPIGDLPY